MVNIKGHEIEVLSDGDTITVSGIGASWLHAQLEPTAAPISYVTDNSFSFRYEEMMTAIALHENGKLFDLMQPIFEEAASQNAERISLEQTQQPEIKGRPVKLQGTGKGQ